MTGTAELFPVQEVWASNFSDELDRISTLLDDFPLIAVDTEFSGEIYRPEFVSGNLSYDRVKINTDNLTLIQVGLTLSNKRGDHPKAPFIWQFNLQISLDRDFCAADSGNLLINAGLDLQRHEKDGISPIVFGERLTTSNLVLNDNVTWISFSASYDFAYLIKLLTNDTLPSTEELFTKKLRLFFPVVNDIKIILQTKRSLNHLAKEYGVERIGTNHQAGSDSAVTLSVYQEVMKSRSLTEPDERDYNGFISGIGQKMDEGMCDPAADYAHIVDYTNKNDKSDESRYIDGIKPITFQMLITNHLMNAQHVQVFISSQSSGLLNGFVHPMDPGFSTSQLMNPPLPSPAPVPASFVPRSSLSNSSTNRTAQAPPQQFPFTPSKTRQIGTIPQQVHSLPPAHAGAANVQFPHPLDNASRFQQTSFTFPGPPFIPGPPQSLSFPQPPTLTHPLPRGFPIGTMAGTGSHALSQFHTHQHLLYQQTAASMD
ncbi:putative CCR4-NOT transcription complex subunit 7 [Blattamonas nauphoetae]|uniref:poly(A)-specific ribonuclease n=1 Tax=Blattamonas nauphoetae TaxID=2049346 RepID=A0ABQ9YKN2_9EUKA|nr:putative CCR4-NOT transcription complex subunit 7 [Blattamonas nauphoetae]